MATYDLTTVTKTITNLCPAANGATGFNVGGGSENKIESSTTHTKYSPVSLKMIGSASHAEVCAENTTAIPLDSTHIYYARLEAYQEVSGGGMEIYWPIAEPHMFHYPAKEAGTWNMYSIVINRGSFTSGNYTFRLDFNHDFVDREAWYDGWMIIDLTATFGAGNEPTKDWCDKNIPYFEGTLKIIDNLADGDTISCPYSGAKNGILLPVGKYKLEAWGAGGGTYTTTTARGGLGGYASGTLQTIEPQGLIIYAGGAGTAYTTSTYTSQGGGGFNGGGGAGYRGGGGGGASDFRLRYDSLYSRILVAGGGGGSYCYDTTYKAIGGHGGGFDGSTGAYYSSGSNYTGKGASLIAGGAGGTANSTNYNGKAGTFGAGGSTGYKYNSTSYYSAGGGGGGWYGGGGAGNYSSTSRNYAAGGGGGSSYYWNADTAAYYPEGCLLSEDDYLESGYSQAGINLNNGKCLITVLGLGNLDKVICKGDTIVQQAKIKDSMIKAIYLGENQIVPKLPTFVDYIELKGEQYIDTCYKPSSKTTFEIVLEMTQLDGNSAGTDWIPMLGSRDATVSPYINSLALFNSKSTNTSLCFVYNNTNNTSITIPSTILAKNTIKIDNNKLYFNESLVFTATAANFSAAQSLVIGSSKNIGGDVDSRRMFAKIYSCKIWDDGILIRDFKPAIDNQGVICLYDLVNKEYYYSLGKSELLTENNVFQVTRAVLDTGTFTNVTPTYLTNQQNGSDGFTITGRNTTASGSATFSGHLRWDYTLDMTDYKAVTFYCKKGADHGVCHVYIDGNQELAIHYRSLSTSWTKYTVILNPYVGTHTISFVGGYTDSTGNTSSSTSYCDIKFIK